MIDARTFATLQELPEPLLTVYLDTNPGSPSNCRSNPGYVAWLKTEARDLLARAGHSQESLLQTQIHRVEQFLHEERPGCAGVAIFAGPGAWQVIPLHVEPLNELHWGKPQAWQLRCIADRNKPACAVVLDHSGARFYARTSEGLTQFAEQPFKIDVSQWKQKEHAHMARQGTHMPHGAQRDLFEHRLESEYVPLLREVARSIAAFCDAHSIDQVYLLGADRLTKRVQLRLPQRLREHVTRIAHVSPEEPAAKTQARLEANIREYETSRKELTVEELLDQTHGVVTGMDPTLSQLQRGLLASLVLVEAVNPVLQQCEECGLVTTSALSRCPACSGLQSATRLHEMLPMLLTRHGCRMDLVEGRAASRLQTVGGIGGRLRTLKHKPVMASGTPGEMHARAG